MKDALKKYGGMLLRLIVAAALLYWVMHDLDLSGIRRLSWKGICFSYFGTLLIILIQTTLTALRWKMLLHGQGIELGFFRTVSLTFQGSMFSLFMPGGAVGGDVLKAAFLTQDAGKGKAVEGVMTIFLDRVIGMLGLFGLAILFALFFRSEIAAFPQDARILVWILALISLAGFSAGTALLYQDVIFRVPLFAWLLRKADGLVKGALTRILKSVETCRRDRITLWKAFLMSLLILHPLLISCGVLILYGISDNQEIQVKAPLTAVTFGNVASVAPVSPGGLGTRDKVTEIILRAFNVDKNTASLIPLLYSCAYVSVGLAGIPFFLIDTFRKKDAIAKSPVS